MKKINSTAPQVVISAGGRFHAHRLANQLQKKSALKQLFTFDYNAADHDTVNAQFVKTITSCKIINDLFLRFQCSRFFDKARFNIFKDNLFDTIVAKKISHLGQFNLFVGWAHYSLHSIAAAKKAGATVIIESGSCHIVEQKMLLDEEYAWWGIESPAINQRVIDKMLAEYKQADYIMTLSSFARNSFIKQGFSEEKILMVPCGVDIEFFKGKNKISTASKFRVIFVGLVSLRKGIQNLIQAWKLANVPRDNSELIVVGAPQKDFMLIKDKLPISSNINFIGPTDRNTLKQLYQTSSVFVLPSIEDGFGMVIGEAMASGLPVICSTHSAAPEIITDGKHGFLFEPNNVTELAEKIRWCYEHHDEARAMGLEGQQRIRDFSWDNYGAKIYAEYVKILGLP